MVLVLLAGLPPAASGRLPDRLAIHWSAASGRPDGSMPLWAAAAFPALIWAVLTAVVVLAVWRSGTRTIPGWAVATFGCGGVPLVGGQVSVVRANMDREDWHGAGSVTGWVVGTLVVTAVSGAVALFTLCRKPAAPRSVTDGPTIDVPAGHRFVWLSRTSNPWLQTTFAVTGLLAVAAGMAALAGLTDLTAGVVGAAALAVSSVLTLCCSSVQARVSERGLEVTFGPWAGRDGAGACGYRVRPCREPHACPSGWLGLPAERAGYHRDAARR